MDLGAFSISLTVKDIKLSLAFYEKLGFEVIHGEPGQGWIVLKNGNHVIGLFQGMFDRNILTFNPGWDQSAQNVDPFTDIRVLKAQLIANGIDLVSDDVVGESGPSSIMVQDPDGNHILIDQHR